MASSDLRADSGISDRTLFTLALDELQAAMIVVPTDVIYEPKFTYLGASLRNDFPGALAKDQPRDRSSGNRAMLPRQSRTDGSRRTRACDRSVPSGCRSGNRALVKEGYAEMIAPGTYRKLRL